MMNLLKILIVDDDATVRIGLKTLIAWEQYGYRLVGEAANGQQAIEIVHREQPHIIITDMKMPVMDGLTLIKTLKNEEGFSVAFLVLSSYDDFELVKGAMKLGAVDYFLKLELDVHMLLSCLDEVRKTITSADSSCENETVGGVSALQSKVIRNIISNYFFTEEEMIKQLKQSGIHLDTDSMYCLFIKINNILIFEESTEEEYYTLNYGIINVITEISNDCFDAYCVEGKTGEFYVIIAAQKDMKNGKEEELVALTARRLHKMLWQYLNLDCTVGIGRGKTTLDGIRKACHQAVEAVKSHYFLKNDEIIDWRNCPIPIQKGFILEDCNEIIEAKQQLKHALSVLREDEIASSLKVIKENLLKSGHSKETILFILIEVFTCVREVFGHYSMSTHDILLQSWRTYTEFLTIKNVEQALSWIDNLREDLQNYVRNEIKKDYQDVVFKAKEIIDENYSLKLSLTDIAMRVHLDPSYLSSLMRKHLGMSYSEYLTNVRIEQAKRLLANSSQKLSAIAETVGYPDQFYFNRLFKRVCGIAPGEYRKRIQNQRNN